MIPFSAPFYTKEDRRAWNEALRAFPPPQCPDKYAVALEMEIADRLGWSYPSVLATNSCTSAMAMFYHLRGAKRLFAPVLTWPSTYSCFPGAVVLHDGKEHFQVFCSTDAVAVVDLWGESSPTARFERLRMEGCRHILLDAAQNLFGPRHRKLLDEGLVDAIAYSFGPIKQVSACRGGALVLAARDGKDDLYRRFRDSGTIGRDMWQQRGFNFEMGEPNAALALSQMSRFAESQVERQAQLRRYKEELNDRHWNERAVTVHGESGHLAVLECTGPDWRTRIAGALLRAGIAVGHHYPLPLWLNHAEYPEALALSRCILTLPCYVGLREKDQTKVIRTVREVLR